jgi:hypothetical protein
VNIAEDERLQQRLRKDLATARGRPVCASASVEHRLAHLVRRQDRRARYRAFGRTSSTYGAPRPSRTSSPSSARWRDEIPFNPFGVLEPLAPAVGSPSLRARTRRAVPCNGARFVAEMVPSRAASPMLSRGPKWRAICYPWKAESKRSI